MKNFYLVLCLIISFTMSACQTEGEDISYSFFRISANFIYPNINNNDLYKITFNKQDISDNFFSSDDKEGLFQVYSKNPEKLELETVITTGGRSQNIQLIKLPGKNVEIYDKDSYITFSTTLSLFEGYELVFNGQEIVDGINYINKKNVSGTFEFYKENEDAPVYSIEDVSLVSGDEFVILQSSENEFISLSNEGDEEEAPLTNNLSKIRFFYSPIGTLNVDAIEVELISYDASISAVDVISPSVIVEKGKLSSYIELDIAKYKDTYNSPAGFGYSIYVYDKVTQTRGELLEDVMNGNNMFSIDAQAADAYKTKYKFATYQITNKAGFPSKFIMGAEW